jgi:hypothetical protein
MEPRFPARGDWLSLETIDNGPDTAGQRKNAIFVRIPICYVQRSRALVVWPNPSRFNCLMSIMASDWQPD